MSKHLTDFNSGQNRLLSSRLSHLPAGQRNRTLEEYLLLLPNTSIRSEFTEKLKESKSILEVGCGCGYALPDLLQNSQDGALVVGVDIDPNALKCIKRAIIERKIPQYQILEIDEDRDWVRLWEMEIGSTRKTIVVYRTDVAHMSKCLKNRFELIVSVYAYWYFSDKVAALARMMDSLGKGGEAYIITGAQDILVFEIEPELRLFKELQEILSNNEDLKTMEVISTFFKERGITYKAFDAYGFMCAYFRGITPELPVCGGETTLLKVTKYRDIRLKTELPHYHTFLVGHYERSKTFSVYVKKRLKPWTSKKLGESFPLPLG